MKKFKVLIFTLIFGLCGLLFAVENIFALNDADELLNLFINKGIISEEEAASYRSDLAIKKLEEEAAKNKFEITASKPIKLSSYIQARVQNIKNDKDAFDIRRLRLDLKGEINEKFDYRAQIEFGGTKGPFLLDGTIGYKLNPFLKLTIGQFKIPFSQENLASSPKLEIINRSQIVEALVARGKDVIGNQNGRDIGLQLSGNFLAKDDYFLFDYALGIFNGAGINKADTNDQKDFVGRIVYHPSTKLSLGLSYYNGKYTSTTSLDKRLRLGGEFVYVNSAISLKGEYIKGKDGNSNKVGWYAQLGYFLVPAKFQWVLKYDSYDKDTSVDDNETNVYTIGFNKYFNKWSFLQLNYEIKKEKGTEISNNNLVTQFTLQF